MNCRSAFLLLALALPGVASLFTGCVPSEMAAACARVLSKANDQKGPVQDRYPSFLALQKAEVEGLSFLRTFQKRESPFLVAAIHGGLLEEGTEHLAAALAAEDHSFYIFESLIDDESRMHVTSHRFNDPDLLSLAMQSKKCISFHGFYVDLQAEVCLGGLNTELKNSVFKAIQKFDPSLRVLHPCEKFAGAHSKNFVNQCQHSGVQIELSGVFRQRLMRDPHYFDGFVNTLKQAFEM